MTARVSERGGSVADAVTGALPGPHPRRWFALAVALLAVYMDMLDASVVVVALPSIQGSLAASSAALQWIVAAYTLAFALGLITGGRLGDIYGRKRVFLLGVAGFAVASALAGTAEGATVLVGARMLQGATAAMMVPQVLAFVQVDFPARERPKAFALYGMTFALGGMSGPLLGGLLTQADLFGWGWRTIFLINLPVAALTLLGAAVLLPGARATQASRPDPVGIVLATLALLALLYPLIQGRELGWPPWALVSMAASVPAFALFVVHQRHMARRGKTPVIDMGLFRHHGVLGGLLVALIFFLGTGYHFVLTLHLQEGLGYSPLRTGLTFLAFSVGVVLGSGASMQLVPKLGRRIVIAGAPVMALGMVAIALAAHRYGTGLHPWQLVPGLVVGGIGMAMVATTLVTVVLARVPERDAGSASGVVNTTLQVGTAASVAVLGTVFFSLLGDGPGFVGATEHSLTLAAALLLLAVAPGFLLPKGPVQVRESGEAAAS